MIFNARKLYFKKRWASNEYQTRVHFESGEIASCSGNKLWSTLEHQPCTCYTGCPTILFTLVRVYHIFKEIFKFSVQGPLKYSTVTNVELEMRNNEMVAVGSELKSWEMPSVNKYEVTVPMFGTSRTGEPILKWAGE